MIEKVVGTTFVKQAAWSDIKGHTVDKSASKKGVNEYHTLAALIPEPENPYDASAVAVYIPLESGSFYRAGYLAKDSELKKDLTGPIKLPLTIYEYDRKNHIYNQFVLDTSLVLSKDDLDLGAQEQLER